MKFALDTEFIDTPKCSHLLSLGLVREDDATLYLEFPYDDKDLTPWLDEHVVPLLSGNQVTHRTARPLIREFVGGSKFNPPQFWAYYAAYDWYWFCRVFGGMMEMPDFYPHKCRDFSDFPIDVPDLFGPKHHALNDAKSLMAAMKKRDADIKARIKAQKDYNDRAR